MVKNQPFYLRDAEQAIDNINSLSSNDTTIEMDVNRHDNLSNILIKNEIANQAQIKLGYDNFGQLSTGKYRHKANLSFDNILALNDNLLLNYTKDNNDHSLKKYESFFSSFNFPISYWRFGYSFASSKYLTSFVDNEVLIKSSGEFTNRQFWVEKALSRKKSYKITYKTNLNLKNNVTFLNQNRQQDNSVKLSILENSIIFNHFRQKPDSNLMATSYLQLTHHKGLNDFNAKSDDVNLTTNLPHAQFDKLELNFFYNDNLTKNLKFKSHILAQKSSNSLYPIEKLTIGSLFLLRGFDQNSLNGDNGFVFSNDIDYHFSNVKYLNNIHIGAFYDYGYVRNDFIDDRLDEGYMSGAGAKINYFSNLFDANLIYSKSIRAPRSLQNILNQQLDEETIYLDINFLINIL